MKIAYVAKSFRDDTLDLIDYVNDVIEEYQAQGFQLTLRQLYYQLVSRDVIPNQQKEYKRLGSIVADGRLAGLIDWEAIEDRTRNLARNPHWDDANEIMEAAISGYANDKWENQLYRVECWIEKDALTGVIAPICRSLDVPYFSCRGYTSLSEMWQAGQRLGRYLDDAQTPIILHLGDHDPSGIDMSRDIEDRLEMFVGEPVHVIRIALNRDQVDQFNPPPNPAKLTDSRVKSYIKAHGRQSWELDALEPGVMQRLIEAHVLDWRDDGLWQEALAKEEEGRENLRRAARLLSDGNTSD